MSENDSKADWLLHPYTRVKLREAEASRDGMVKALIGKAMTSSDPEVRAIASRIYASDVFIKNLGGGVKFFEEAEKASK